MSDWLFFHPIGRTLIHMAPLERDPAAGMNGAVAAVLRGERAASGVTLEELSGMTEIPVVSLQRYLKAKRHLDVDIVWNIALALDLEPTDVFSQAKVRLERENPFAVQESAARDEDD